MHRARYTFRQRDLRLAVETARAAGLEISRVEIDRYGKIVVVTGKQPVNDDLYKELAEFEGGNGKSPVAWRSSAKRQGPDLLLCLAWRAAPSWRVGNAGVYGVLQ
jgi:hypothetical protein